MNQCDCCGKFRKVYELVTMEGDSSDGFPGGTWLECMYCMSNDAFGKYSQLLMLAKMHKELAVIESKRIRRVFR